MATVTSKTSTKIDDLLANLFVDAEFIDGNLLLTTKSGSVVNAGNINGKLDRIQKPNPSDSLQIANTLATYQEHAPNLPGFIVIQTNVPYTQHMTRLHIRGWDYAPNNNIIDLTITLYPFTDGNIHNADFVNNGTTKFSSIQILKRISDNRVAIALHPATASNYWQYPKLVVDGMFGHDIISEPSLSNWSISRVSSLAGFTTQKLWGDDPILITANNYKAQNLPSGSWYNIDFWSPEEVHPELTLSGGVEGRTTWTIMRPGLYDVRFTAMFRNDVSSNGVRGAGIFLNTSQITNTLVAPVAATADYVSAYTQKLIRLNAGHYIHFRVLQTTGAAIDVNQGYTQCSILRVSH